MIRRMKRAAKLNSRTRRYRWPWGTGVWRFVDVDAGSFISDDFDQWMREAEALIAKPLPTITFEP